MPIYIGNRSITALYLGSTALGNIYAGNVLSSGPGGGGSGPDTVTITAYQKDDNVFDTGAAFGRTVAEVPFGGGASSDGSVPVRVVNYDDETTVVATDTATAVSGLILHVIDVPKVSQRLKIQAQQADNTWVDMASSIGFYVGHVSIVIGQSEASRALSRTGSGTGYGGTINRDGQFRIVQGDETFQGGSPGTDVTGFSTSTVVITSANAGGQLASHVGDIWQSNSSDNLLVIDACTSGTSRGQLGDDSTDRRRWQDLVAVLNEAGWADGVRPGLMVDFWNNADGVLLGNKWADVLAPFYFGRELDGTEIATGGTTSAPTFETVTGTTTYTWDNFLFDRTAQARGIFSITQTKVVFTHHRYDPNGTGLTKANWIIRSDTPTIENQCWQQEAVRAFGHQTLVDSTDGSAFMIRGWDPMNYENGTEATPGVWGDNIHPGEGDDGLKLFARHIGHSILFGFGVVTAAQPVLDNVDYDVSGNFATFWSSAGDVTTTRILRSEAEPDPVPGTHWTQVLGFEFRDRPVEDAVIVDGSGNPASAGRIRVSVPAAEAPADWTKDRIWFGRGMGAGMMNSQADQLAGGWKNYPVLAASAVSLNGIADDTRGTSGAMGVAVRPTPRRVDHAPAQYRTAALTIPAGGWFQAVESQSTINGQLGNEAVRYQARVAVGDTARGAGIFGQASRNRVNINRVLDIIMNPFQGTTVTVDPGPVTPWVRHDYVAEYNTVADTARLWIDGVLVAESLDFTSTLGGLQLQSFMGNSTADGAGDFIWELEDLAIFFGDGAATGDPAVEPSDDRRWFRVRASDGAAAIQAAQGRVPSGAWYNGPAF